MRSFRAEFVQKPWNWRPFDLPAAPLDLEIGCGVGFHPIRYARRNPDRFVVAIEHTRARYESFARRVANHPAMPNLLPVHADAVAWVTHSLPARSVERLFLLYPNPYPKAADRNKRWHAMPFMGRLIEALKPGGTIELATNVESYFTEARDYLTESWGLALVHSHAFDRDTAPEGAPRTHFEKKYLERGERCYNLLVMKGPS